jgi:exo-1,4-beta-D-glucosaminidase
LIAPIYWSDNWIEVTPGESRTVTALLPESAGEEPVVRIEGWNIVPETIHPVASIAKN